MILLLLFLTGVDLVSLVADIVVVVVDVYRLGSHKLDMRARLHAHGRSSLVDSGALVREDCWGLLFF